MSVSTIMIRSHSLTKNFYINVVLAPQTHTTKYGSQNLRTQKLLIGDIKQISTHIFWPQVRLSRRWESISLLIVSLCVQLSWHRQSLIARAPMSCGTEVKNLCFGYGVNWPFSLSSSVELSVFLWLTPSLNDFNQGL